MRTLLIILGCLLIFTSLVYGASTYSTNYGLEMPAFQDTNWHTALNANAVTLDAIIGKQHGLRGLHTTITPDADGTRDIGTSTSQFKDIYIGGTVSADDISLNGDLTLEGYISSDIGSSTTPLNDIYVGGFVTGEHISVGSKILPDTNNNSDIGTGGLQFKDLYLDGTATCDDIFVSGKILPDTDASVDIGTDIKEFRDIYIDGIASIDALVVRGAVSSDLNPDIDNYRDLGDTTTVTKRWKDIHLSGSIISSDGSTNPYNHFLNGSFELWSDGSVLTPDGWSGDFAHSEQTTTAKLGSYSAVVHSKTGLQGYLNQQVHLARGIAYWKGRQVTISGWVSAASASTGAIQWYDGVSSYLATHTGSGDWEYMSHSATVDSSATLLEVRCYSLASDTQVQFDGLSLIEGEHIRSYAPHPTEALADGITAVQISEKGLFIDQNSDYVAFTIDTGVANDGNVAEMSVAGSSPSTFLILRNDDVNGNVCLRLGGSYLWIDATNNLRLDKVNPTADLGGTLVGTQS